MIKDFIRWILNHCVHSKKEKISAWPFPVVSEEIEPRTKKKRVTVPKATTRKTVAKKATTVAKKATKTKKAK